MGRKAKVRYSETIKALAVKAAAAAATDAEIAEVIGCAEATIRRWKKSREGFADALEAARIPDESKDILEALERRKVDANKMLDEYFASGGKVERVVQEGDGLGSYTREVFKLLPDKWLIERILGPGEQPEVDPFQVVVTVANPDLDDDIEFTREEFEDDDY